MAAHGRTFDDILDMYGPSNRDWLRDYLNRILKEAGLYREDESSYDEKILSILENVLSRIFQIPPGTALGSMIAFELSQDLSQSALDSTHDLKCSAGTASSAHMNQEFEKCLTFSGLLSHRKSKFYNFIKMDFVDGYKPPYETVEPGIYAVPLKETNLVVAMYAKKIQFITQPYQFRNELCTFISTKNLFSYFAEKNGCTHLIPLLHFLALISAKKKVPVPFTRHGIKSQNIDFMSRAAFEDVMNSFQTAAIDSQTVQGNRIAPAIFCSQKPNLGTQFFDLVFPPL